MRPTSISKYQFPICDPVPVSYIKSLARTATGRVKKYRGTKRIFIEHLRTGGFRYASQIMDPNDQMVPVKGPEGKVQIVANNSTVRSTEPRCERFKMHEPQEIIINEGDYTRYCTNAEPITRGQIDLAWNGVLATAYQLDRTNVYMPSDIITLNYHELDEDPDEFISADFDPDQLHDDVFLMVCMKYRGYLKRYFIITEDLRVRDGPEKRVFDVEGLDVLNDTIQMLQIWYNNYINGANDPDKDDRDPVWLPPIFGDNDGNTYATGHKVAYCFKIASSWFHLEGNDNQLTIRSERGVPRPPVTQLDLYGGAAGSDTAHVNAFLALSHML
jgi:hypothetical protein